MGALAFTMRSGALGVLSQPAAIKVVTDMAKQHDVVCFFDAGDVQANGFQVVEDERPTG